MARKIAWSVRAQAYAGLIGGESALDVGARLGVGRVTVTDWAKLAGMEFRAGREGGGLTRSLARVEPSDAGRSYRRLTLTDRSFIHAARSLERPWSMRAIARELDVAPSTISREISRHQVEHWGVAHYDAALAHHRAGAARSTPRAGKLDSEPLRAEVVSMLSAKYSPQQVAGELPVRFPDRTEMRVSHETIYQALYVQGKGALRHELSVVKALRSGRTTRVPQSKLPRRSSRPWLEGALLADRPAEAADRAVPGHWEGDLVVGPGNSGIITLVERSTRYALLGRLPGRRDSETVTDVLARMIEDLPATLTRTITWDQGTEMAGHAAFTIRTGCPVYFCDPHSPWQRGTNENTNGLIRDFYPKGFNFNTITDADLAETQRLLNIRPRQTLGFRSPTAKMRELIAVALAA
ncbi:IS30 family transposase [Rathayibacter sp. VKM Ac-2803]|uniref:IS30 family transposase n=1 Tax=Rathayibacter sp. VKM Ac-2803 TaxID=2609256 RepID=UPI003FA71A79